MVPQVLSPILANGGMSRVAESLPTALWISGRWLGRSISVTTVESSGRATGRVVDRKQKGAKYARRWISLEVR
jgi:hypothetical protein